MWRQCFVGLRHFYKKLNDFVLNHHVVLFLTIFLVSTLLAAIPLYFGNTLGQRNHGYAQLMGISNADDTERLQYNIADDQVVIQMDGHVLKADAYNVAAAVASIVVVLPSIIDTIIDSLPESLVLIFYNDGRPRLKPFSTDIIRFTHLERCLFFIGTMMYPIAVLAIAARPPTDFVDNVFLYRTTVTWANITLKVKDDFIVGSVMMLLIRLSNVWPPLLCFIVFFTKCVGTILTCISQSLTITTKSYTAFETGGVTIGTYIAIAFGALGILMSLRQYAIDKYNLEMGCFSFSSIRSQPLRLTNQFSSMADKSLRTAVIGLHIFILLFFALSSLLRTRNKFYSTIWHHDHSSLAKIIFLNFGSALMVVILEGRIRKNEVNRSLYAAIDAKKSYAHFIEEKVRQPLYVGMLSARFIMDRLVSETDQNSSITKEMVAAFVTVSNALSSFFQMENMAILENATDKLKMVKNVVLIIPFIQECMYMMKIEAARKEITLTIRYDKLERLQEESDVSRTRHELGADSKNNEVKKWNKDVHDQASMITESDITMVARNALTQALRSLITHLISDTNEGGQVRIAVCFIPNRNVRKQTTNEDRGVKESRWKGLGRRSDPSSTSAPQIAVIDRYTHEADLTGVMDEIRSNSSNASNERQQQQQQLIKDRQEQLTGALVIQMSYISSSSSMNAALLSRLFTLEDVEPQDPTSAGQRLWLHATKSVVDMHGGNIQAVPLSYRETGDATTGVSFIIELPMTRIVDVSCASGSNSVGQSSLPPSIPAENAQGLGSGQGQGSNNQPLSQPLPGTTTNAHSNLNHPTPLVQISSFEQSPAMMLSQPQNETSYHNNNTTFPNDGNNHLSYGHMNNINYHYHDRGTSEIDRASILSPSDVLSSITLPHEIREQRARDRAIIVGEKRTVTGSIVDDNMTSLSITKQDREGNTRGLDHITPAIMREDVIDTSSSIDYSPVDHNTGRIKVTSEKTLLTMTIDEDRMVTVLEITCLPMEIDDDIAVLLRMCGPFGSVMQAHLLNDTTDVNMIDADGLSEGQGAYIHNNQTECLLKRARVHMRGSKNAKRCAEALNGLVLFEGAFPLTCTVLE